MVVIGQESLLIHLLISAVEQEFMEVVMELILIIQIFQQQMEHLIQEVVAVAVVV